MTMAPETIVDRYEALRATVLTQRTGIDRQGLALLMREGMAQWSSAWASCARSRPAPGGVTSLEADPELSEAGALVQLLASMALSSMQGESA
jgi:hypothetical protein